ncbi:MAG: hypothetical protein SW127_11620 [Actinomycetota bacterium]|nr:hypothetical protein [Actinomycetota bacterium]
MPNTWSVRTGADLDELFDVKVIYQGDHTQVEIGAVPPVFLPRVGPFGLIDYDKVFAADPDDDIFTARGISRSGAVVVVRPDQYVAVTLPLDASDELTEFFASVMLPKDAAHLAKERA